MDYVYRQERRLNIFTWDISALSWAYPGKTECPTPKACLVLAGWLAGWLRWLGHRSLTPSKNTSSMESWHQGSEPLAFHGCDTRMSACEPWRCSTLMQYPRRAIRIEKRKRRHLGRMVNIKKVKNHEYHVPEESREEMDVEKPKRCMENRNGLLPYKQAR